MAELQPVQWEKVYEEAIKIFQTLLQFDTTNPPGNEKPCAEYVAGLLKKAGYETHLFDSAENRSNLVARFNSGSSEGPLLLSSHLDVVPADAEFWKQPPFSGNIADNFIWGRGAVDMKNMTAYCLMTMLLIKELGLKLKRDVIFLSVSDEEAGGDFGSKWMVHNKPEFIRAEYGLNELGGFTLHIGNARVYPVQVAEKGFVWFKLKIKGEPGHGSIPHDQNPVLKLARVIDKIHKNPLPFHVTDVARQFISALAKELPFPRSAVFNLVLNPSLSNFIIKKVLPDKDQANAIFAQLHNTISPTGLAGSRKVNVIPSQAEIICDGRILPGQTQEGFFAELKAVLGEDNKDIEIEVINSGLPASFPSETPLFRTITDVLQKNDPGCKVIPYLIVGYTDAKYYEELGVKTYGFSPVKLPPDINFTKLYHGHNERIPVEGFTWGLKTFFEVVEKFCEKAGTGS